MSIYEEITKIVTDAIDSGEVMKWDSPWTPSIKLPRNWEGTKYKGINSLILNIKRYDKKYESVHWVTAKRCRLMCPEDTERSKRPSVIKGEKATKIIAWKPITNEDLNTGKTHEIFIPIVWNVFNSEQIDWKEFPQEQFKETGGKTYDTNKETDEVKIIHDFINAYLNEYKIDFYTKGQEAYYSPSHDHIYLPDIKYFKNGIGYAATAAHETVHSTGHSTRLKRIKKGHGRDKEKYSQEELVAEMGAAAIMAELGLVDIKNNKNTIEYLRGWSSILKDKKDWLIYAGQRAGKALDMIKKSLEKATKAGKDYSITSIAESKKIVQKLTEKLNDK